MELKDKQRLLEVGNEWQRGTMYRIYINDLARWYGLQYTTYKTGNVSSAKLDGEPISNGKASDLLRDLYWAKLWLDVKDDKFYSKGLEPHPLNKIVANIRAWLAESE